MLSRDPHAGRVCVPTTTLESPPQFRDLPDVSEVVHGPLVEHLLQPLAG
jgi:hypothetical protein